MTRKSTSPTGHHIFKVFSAFALVIAVAAGTCAFGAGRAAAAETRSFDATLSLTGDCSVNPNLDPIPDPGCPGGTHPPAGHLTSPRSIATDEYGDIYVASYGNEIPGANGTEGRIDVFTASGDFVTEIVDSRGPKNIAVDGEGNLYVHNFRGKFTIEEEAVGEIVRYAPTVYRPESGEIAYGSLPVIVSEEGGSNSESLAVNPDTGHLYSYNGGRVTEYGSAAEGNPVLDGSIGAGRLRASWGTGLAVDAANGRIYVNSGTYPEFVVSVLELAAPHALVQTIARSATPAGGQFSSEMSVAVDEGNGHVFVYDGGSTEDVFEFSEDGTYLETVEHSFQHGNGAEITVDNGAHSPNGALNPGGRYLFVPSGRSGTGHSYAFSANPPECAPVATAATSAGITESEVELSATVNPCNVATSYVFEYTPESAFEEEGFAGAQTGGQGDLAAGGTPVEVQAPVAGLEAGRSYRFRLVATNAIGSASAEGSFATYPANPISASCANSSLRTGLSALLPDCRAFELVTPGVTNAREPIGVGHLGTYFSTLQASPDGEKVSFDIEGGTIPGVGGKGGTGSYASDPYLATRTAAGWTTTYQGPSGLEAAALLPGSSSPDQEYSFWSTAGPEGTAAIGGSTNYVELPAGTSELVGTGSLGIDPSAEGDLIGDGGRVIFSTSSFLGRQAVQLEPEAPPTGTPAVYSRSGGVTRVVSLLPGDVTPAADEAAVYVGASRDGRGVAFTLEKEARKGPLYLRYEDQETYEIGSGLTFAGIAEGGGRIFYLQGGNLFAFDVATESTIPFSSSGDVTVVNLAADGDTAYIVSHSVLTKVGNAAGQKPKSGKENLYRSEEGQISFVGTVTKRDVEGENPGNGSVGGLGLWTADVGRGALGADPSRTTPDGRFLLFESRAALGSYDPEGHPEVYRYDAASEEVSCLSCMPTGAAATGEASLESISQGMTEAEPFSFYALVENLTTDGDRAFFQSTEALVPSDTDGLQDVYEWEAGGVGSCSRSNGCLYLVSSGHSAHPNYLFGVGANGNDVFFRSPDRLLASDTEATASLYDARVDGGFSEAAVGTECQGEGCRPGLTPAPALPSPAVPAAGANDNVRQSKRCPAGKKRVKGRCVKRKQPRRKSRPAAHRSHANHKKGAGK